MAALDFVHVTRPETAESTTDSVCDAVRPAPGSLSPCESFSPPPPARWPPSAAADAALRDSVAIQHTLDRTAIVPQGQPCDDAFAHRTLPPPDVLPPRVTVERHFPAFSRADPRPLDRHLLSRKHHVAWPLAPAHAVRSHIGLMSRPYTSRHFALDYRVDDFQSRQPPVKCSTSGCNSSTPLPVAAASAPPIAGLPPSQSFVWTCSMFPDRFSSPRRSSQKEFPTRTLSESGSGAATPFVHVSTKGGTISQTKLIRPAYSWRAAM